MYTCVLRISCASVQLFSTAYAYIRQLCLSQPNQVLWYKDTKSNLRLCDP